MNAHRKILADIKNRQIKPIYFLHGEEPYFIDLISDYIADNVLTEDEKSFNQSILYGMDTTVDEVVASAKRFPMMAEYQVVILKEAQGLGRGNVQSKLAEFENYFKNPQLSTVLVVCFKYKKADGRRAYLQAAKKNGVVFESKKLYENKIPQFIQSNLEQSGFRISHKAAYMLTEFLGTDLGKINNELEKLRLVIPKGTEITPELIEKNIGFSKDFNNFELQNALGSNDFKKAFRIIDYFAQNPKDNPILGTLPLLFRYFSQLLQYHGLQDKSQKNVASQLKVHPFFVKDYAQAARVFSMKRCSHAIEVLRDVDVRVKGVGSTTNVKQGDYLKELLVKIAR
ncbi:MAG TPA: DNA polymerase III subunit delta [Flavobacteriaceae bacterium]|nr:DNA polymerase III subunit delta [Flavobacteriaceae bacterium]